MDRITKLIPTQPLNIKLKDARKAEPQFDELARKDPRVKEVLEVAERLEGMARNASVHAAGVVISPVPLKELVPLYKTNKDEIVTQYDMVGLEKLGLLKMDFLGLTTLTIIDDALKLIERHRGVKAGHRRASARRQEDLRDGLSQRPTPAACSSSNRRACATFCAAISPIASEDLCALNALYRPGPMGMIDDFIDRKHGRKEVVYDLPEMKEILEETYGVMVYQEQVMQISNRLAGYSLGEADLLRRAMGKKKVEEMAKQRARFVEGGEGQGTSAAEGRKDFRSDGEVRRATGSTSRTRRRMRIWPSSRRI